MSSSHDVENVQTGKLRNRKVILIAALVAVVVILTAVFGAGAVYFSSETLDVEVPRPQSAHLGGEASKEEETSVPSSISPNHHTDETTQVEGASFEAEDPNIGHSVDLNFRASAVNHETFSEAFSSQNSLGIGSDSGLEERPYVASSVESNTLPGEVFEEEGAGNGAQTVLVPVNEFEPVNESGHLVSLEAVLPVLDEEQVFVISDPNCKKKDFNECELVLHKTRTSNKNNENNTIIAQDTDRSAQKTHEAKVSPNGRFIGFIRTYGNDPEFYFILADRKGKEVRKFSLSGMDWKSEYHFSFTPDSNGIIYTANEGKEIKRVDFTPESTLAPEILLELTSAPELKEYAHIPVLLANGSLVYYVGYGAGTNLKYKVCLKKKDREEPFCWETQCKWEFVLLKFIPFENVVYCVELDAKIWKIDTDAMDINDVKPKFTSFTVDREMLFNGTISDDGKFLYLIASVKGSWRASLIKVDIESAFKEGIARITNDDIVISSFVGIIVAFVPSLRDERSLNGVFQDGN